MSQLFRQQVIDKQARRHMGGIRRDSARRLWLFTLIILAMLLGLIAFLYQLEISAVTPTGETQTYRVWDRIWGHT